MINLLSNLSCIGEAERHFIMGASEKVLSGQEIPVVAQLFCLLEHQSTPFNPTQNVEMEWIFLKSAGTGQINVSEEHDRIGHLVDYSIIRDILVHPENRYLESSDTIANLACKCLSKMFKKSEINLETVIYSVPATMRSKEQEKDYISLK